MKRLPIQRIILAGLAALGTAVAAPTSVHEDVHGVEPIVRRHMELVLSGAGVLMPGNEPYEEDCGIVTYGSSLDEWPVLFRLGLKGEWQDGILVHPFSVRLDDDTGHIVFFDKDGVPFHSVESPVPFAQSSWNRILWNLPATGPVPVYRELSHVVSRYVLVHEKDADERATETQRTGTRGGTRRAMRKGASPNSLPRFRVAEFSATPPTNMTLRVTWENGFFLGTNRIVDVWHGPDITTSRWTVAISEDVSSSPDGSWTFHLNETAFPWYIPPMDCTNANCSCPCCNPIVSTNLVFSGMDPGSTNAVWIVSTNGTCSCPRGVSAAFFKVWPHWDQDGDGILDLDEALNIHSDPLRSDTDGDGMDDGWEILHGLDPRDATGENGRDGDPDADGMSNLLEMASHTHPILADSDGDGFPDGVSESSWRIHNLWGYRNANTNLLLRIETSIPANSDAASAALRLGTLTIPLEHGENLVALCLQQGRLYDFHLGCTGGAEAGISIVGEPGLPGLFVDGTVTVSSGAPCRGEPGLPGLFGRGADTVFSGALCRGGTGTVYFPLLNLFTAPQVGLGGCVHEFPGIQTYRVISSPISWKTLQNRAVIHGFTVESDGTVSLSVSDTPPSVAFGSITVPSSITGLADYCVERTIHRCEADPMTGICPKCGDLGHDVAMTALSILRPSLDKARVGSTNRTAYTAYCIPQGVQAPNWSIFPDDEDGARLHASENPDDEGSGSLEGCTDVWISPGIWTNQYTVTATFPFTQEKSSSRPFTAIAIDAEPICAETNENGIVYNPCMTILGETAQFKINVWPANIPDNAIVWTVSGEGSATFPNGNRGRIVTLRGEEAGDVTLTVSIDGYNGVKPTFTTRVSPLRPVPVDVWICEDAWGDPVVTEAHVSQLISDANLLLRQVCISCFVYRVSYTNDQDFLDLEELGSYEFNQQYDKMVSVPNASTGIEVHFVRSFATGLGVTDPNGTALIPTATAEVFCHEMGHSMGMEDLYEERQGVYEKVFGFVAKERAASDWSGNDERGFYRENLKQAQLIRRHIMHGVASPEHKDISRGDIEALRRIRTFPASYSVTNTAVGMLTNGVPRIPHHD